MRLPITCKDLESIPDKPECCQLCHDNSLRTTAFWDICCEMEEWLSREGISIYKPLDKEHRIIKEIKQSE